RDEDDGHRKQSPVHATEDQHRSEIEADDRDGSGRGKNDVLHHRVHWLPAPASGQSPSYPVALPSGFRTRQRSGSWAARSEKICFASCSDSSTVLRKIPSSGTS